jgi:hypothetical protein
MTPVRWTARPRGASLPPPCYGLAHSAPSARRLRGLKNRKLVIAPCGRGKGPRRCHRSRGGRALAPCPWPCHRAGSARISRFSDSFDSLGAYWDGRPHGARPRKYRAKFANRENSHCVTMAASKHAKLANLLTLEASLGRERTCMKFSIGQPMRRHEDRRLIAGRGRYTDDINLPRMTHAITSPQAACAILSSVVGSRPSARGPIMPSASQTRSTLQNKEKCQGRSSDQGLAGSDRDRLFFGTAIILLLYYAVTRRCEHGE